MCRRMGYPYHHTHPLLDLSINTPRVAHFFIYLFVAGVEAGKTVFYRVGDPRYGWSDIHNFTSTPDAFPFAITVIADSGACI